MAGKLITRDEAIIAIQEYDDKKAGLGVITPSAVCFSLEEISKLLNHASVAFDTVTPAVAEPERGIAFYFVINNGVLSILMVMTHTKDNNADEHLGTGDIFENVIITEGSKIDSGFNLLDIGTKHP